MPWSPDPVPSWACVVTFLSWEVLCPHEWLCRFLRSVCPAASLGRGRWESSVALFPLCLHPANGLFCCVLSFPRVPAPSLSLERRTGSLFACPEAAMPETSWGRRGVSPGGGCHASRGCLWSSVPKHPVCTLTAAGILTWRQLSSDLPDLGQRHGGWGCHSPSARRRPLACWSLAVDSVAGSSSRLRCWLGLHPGPALSLLAAFYRL